MTTKDWGRREGVAVFMRRPDGKIYMAKRTAKDRPFCGLYAAPGGSVEVTESAVQAAVREVEEETGLVIEGYRLLLINRSGPHVTPVERQGSGLPYHMTYFGIDLTSDEVPQMIEPHKQGEWVALSLCDWNADECCPGSIHSMMALASMEWRPSR